MYTQGGAAPGPSGPKRERTSPLTSPSDSQAKEKLLIFVYEYLVHSGAKEAANKFLQEVNYNRQINLAEYPGFLQSWWTVFWDLYCAAPERRSNYEHSQEAKAFHDFGMPPNFQMANGIHPTSSGSPMGGPGMTMHRPPYGAQGSSNAPRGMPPTSQQNAQFAPPMMGMAQGQRPGLPPVGMRPGMPANAGPPPMQSQYMRPAMMPGGQMPPRVPWPPPSNTFGMTNGPPQEMVPSTSAGEMLMNGQPSSSGPAPDGRQSVGGSGQKNSPAQNGTPVGTPGPNTVNGPPSNAAPTPTNGAANGVQPKIEATDSIDYNNENPNREAYDRQEIEKLKAQMMDESKGFDGAKDEDYFSSIA